MFIRPKLLPDGMEGAGDGARFRIRDPLTMVHVADEGEHKPESEYWLRRIQDGGVEIVEPSTAGRVDPAAGAVEQEDRP